MLLTAKHFKDHSLTHIHFTLKMQDQTSTLPAVQKSGEMAAILAAMPVKSVGEVLNDILNDFDGVLPDLSKAKAGYSMVEDYLGFDPHSRDPQAYRVFFLGIEMRPSVDGEGNPQGPRPAAIFFNPATKRRAFAMQAKIVGVFSEKNKEGEFIPRLRPGAYEIEFTGVKKRKVSGVYQDFDIREIITM